jgi:hypothetical protein
MRLLHGGAWFLVEHSQTHDSFKNHSGQQFKMLKQKCKRKLARLVSYGFSLTRMTDSDSVRQENFRTVVPK